jgi:hypothetical protein
MHAAVTLSSRLKPIFDAISTFHGVSSAATATVRLGWRSMAPYHPGKPVAILVRIDVIAEWSNARSKTESTAVSL